MSQLGIVNLHVVVIVGSILLSLFALTVCALAKPRLSAKQSTKPKPGRGVAGGSRPVEKLDRNALPCMPGRTERTKTLRDLVPPTPQDVVGRPA